MDNITKPVIMVFEKDLQANFKEVMHYLLVKGDTQLSEKVNISRNQFFSNANCKFWLKTREKGKWSKCLTGLFATASDSIFYGDTHSKKNLLIFMFSESWERVTIYFFPNYYTRDINNFLKYLFLDLIQKGSA